MSHPIKLSIVTTLYRSQHYVKEFYNRSTKAAEGLTTDFEIIFVNDGCPDNSLAEAIPLAQHDNRVVVIELARNFGHHRALMTGMELSRGERVFLIDSDLEEAPEELSRFSAEMDSSNADVIYGVQRRRKGSWFERLSGNIFYTLFNLLSDSAVPRNLTTARLMKRDYINALVQFKDREVFLGGLFVIAGFIQKQIEINKGVRCVSTYSFRKRLSLMVSSLTSFSNKPLVLIGAMGLVITCLSVIATAVVIYLRLTSDFVIAGWTSVIVSVWLLGGVQLLSIGVVGVYVAKIFSESKRRPYSIIRKVHGMRPFETKRLIF